MHTISAKLKFIALFIPIFAFGQNWQNIGPNKLPTGMPDALGGANYAAPNAGNGAFFTLAAEPNNYQCVYTSGNNSGVRRNIVGNNLWTDANTGFPNVCTADKIVIDKQQRNGVYNIYASNQWGLYRSNDHGSNWTLTGFDPVINGIHVFPTYDPNDEKSYRMLVYDIAPDPNDETKSSVLGNVIVGDENHLIYYSPIGATKNLTLSASNPLSAGSNPKQYVYTDILSFPNNATLQNKKFYVSVNEMQLLANGNLYRDNSNNTNVVKSYIYILELTVSSQAPYTVTETWSAIHSNIYGAGPLPFSVRLAKADIEIMNNPVCSNYVFAFVSGNDPSEKNIMLVSNNFGASGSWQVCKGDYNSSYTNPNTGATTYYPLTKYAVSEKLNNGVPKYIYYYWRNNNEGKAFRTDLSSPVSNNIFSMNYSSGGALYDINKQRISGAFHPDQRDIEVAGDNNGEAIYISDDGGVAVSYDEGVTFQYLNNNEGLNANHVNGISVSEDGTLIAAGFHHSGINYYGTTHAPLGNWVNGFYFPADGGETVIDPYDKNNAYIQVFTSENETKVFKHNNLTGFWDWSNFTTSIFHGSDVGREEQPMQYFSKDRELYAGFKRLYVKKDLTSNSYATLELTNFDVNFIRDIYVSDDKTKMYFIAEEPTWAGNPVQGKIFRNFQANGANTGPGLIAPSGFWKDITADFHLSSPYSTTPISVYNHLGGMAVDPYDYKTIYLALKEYGVSNTGGSTPYRVLKSIDGGDTWNPLSAGLPVFPIHKIILDKATQTLYIGTAGGVYSFLDDGNPNNVWQEFNPVNPMLGKLPKCLVVDLEINHRTRKLFVGTEGYGVWATDLPCVNPNIPTQQVSQNLIWDFRSLLSTIEIKPGYSLTIQGTVYCGANAKIIVDPGAKLILAEGAKITTLASCPTDNWQGILLLGDQYHPQDPAYQGTVELKNGAVIENAINGIIAGDYNNGALNGGIIKADNATFLNCKRDVGFLWYTNTQSASYFNKCSFRCTQILPNNNGYGTGDYVTLNGIQGVRFIGCTRECTIPTTAGTTQPTNNNRGRGVYGIDFSASFENADDAMTIINPTCSLTAGVNCVFKNLTKGIEFQRDNKEYHIYVRGCTFENLGVGIEMYGGFTTSQNPLGCVIWGNEFKWNTSCTIGMPINGDYAGVRTGLDGNFKFDNFYIDKNIFTIDLQQTNGINVICTDINNSGNYYRSEVFENICNNIQTTNLNHTAVRIQSFNDKLELQCGNQYSGFDHDWRLTGGTANFSLKDQGVTSSNYACTNIFTAGKPANIYVLNIVPPMTNHYFRKTASAYNVTCNSTTYLSLNLTLGTCSPSNPCDIGGYIITNGGGGGEGMGFAPNMKPKMDWKNQNELPRIEGPDFYTFNDNNQLKLRPNPANDQIDILYNLNIEHGETGEVSIINSEGKLIKKESVYSLASVKTIDISNLANGIYQVVLNQKGKVLATTKLVVVH